MTDLLRPGAHRAAGVADTDALIAAMLRVEVAWLRALVESDAALPAQADAVAAAASRWRPDVAALAVATEATGNPVVPFVAALRAAVPDPGAAALVHRGLTSQDVLDTALVLLARDAIDRVGADLAAVANRLADLAGEHRATVMAGRTLGQHAVPVTFGLVAAQWLCAILEAADDLARVRAALPVQCGGAAGTLALAAEMVPDPIVTAAAFAAALGLAAPPLPWHVRRSPITRIGDALTSTTDVLGAIATTTVLLSRPELGEVAEAAGGGSSTMPHKRNPVLGVQIRAAAMRAPLLAAALHLAAAQTGEQRPDGAWHSEWPAMRELLQVAVVAASQARDLLEGLRIDVATMRARAHAAAPELLAERFGGSDRVPEDAAVADYLGTSDAFVDAALQRWKNRA